MRMNSVLAVVGTLACAHELASQNLHTATTCGGAAREELLDLVLTQDGGCVAVGWTTSYGTGVSDETPNGYLVKFDATGAVQWTRVLGGSGSDLFNNVEEAENGELLVGGYRYLNAFTAQATLGRFSSSGDPLWLKRVGVSGENLRLHDMIKIGADSLALVCDHFTNGSFYDGKVMLLLADGQGNVSPLAEVTATAGTVPERLLHTADGGYAVLSSRESGMGPNFSKQCALLKFNADGGMAWNRLYTDPGTYLKGSSLASDNAGGFWAFAASGYGQTALMHVDGTGELVGHTGYLMGAHTTVEQACTYSGVGMLAFGSSALNDTTFVGMVLSMDTIGTLLNARFLALEDATTIITAGQLHNDGSLALVGTRYQPLYIGDALLLQMDGPDQGLGSACADQALVMDTIPSLTVEISSPYTMMTPTDVEVGDLFWPPFTGGEVAITCSNLYVAQRTTTENGVIAYPSPAMDELYLHATATFASMPRIRIVDTAGRTVMTPSVRATGDQDTWMINVRVLPPGLYNVVLEDEQGRQAVRFIKG